MCSARRPCRLRQASTFSNRPRASSRDRKSTRLNSSHSQISYAVFCLKKKKKTVSTDSKAPTQHYRHNPIAEKMYCLNKQTEKASLTETAPIASIAPYNHTTALHSNLN